MKREGRFHPLWLRIRFKEICWGLMILIALLLVAAGIDHVKGDKAATLPPSDESKVALEFPPLASRQSNDFFSTYRLDRERVRGQQLEILKLILENKDSDDKAREMALARMVKIAEEMDREMGLEGLVKSEGLKECVALLQGDNITLIIPAGVLGPERLEGIRENLLSFTELPADKMWLKEVGKE